MSGRTPRALVVSAPVGGGHIVAAERIAEKLTRVRGNGDVVVADVGSMLQIGPWTTSSLISGAYALGISAMRGAPHRAAYAFVDRHPAQVERGFRTLFGSQLRQRVLAARPDVVLSTFHALSATLSFVLAPDAVPVVSVVPGAGCVNSLWLCGPVAHFVFPEPHAAAFAVDMGVAASRVSTIPDVFDPEMAIVPGSHAARADLRLDSRFTILLSFGSVGLGRRMLDFLRLLKMARVSTQVIINPGRNKRLRAQVTRYLDASTRLVEPDASLVPYVAAADVVVGKAGWLTLTEATALGTPTLILDHIKGQEDENVRVACLSGAARCVTPAQAVDCIRRYASDDSSMARDFPAAGGAFRARGENQLGLEEIVRSVAA